MCVDSKFGWSIANVNLHLSWIVVVVFATLSHLEEK